MFLKMEVTYPQQSVQITELKKENFNLKLRIYFLEEQIQQKFDGASEDIYKTNIELKVEVESLKHELHEKQHLLIKASKVVESLAGNSDSKIQRTKEDTQKQIKEIEDFLSSKIQSLEEDLKVSQAKVKTLSTLLEERDQAVDTGHTEIPEMHQKDLEASPTLEEKDRIIEQLNIALGSKESLIKQLEEEKAQNKLCDGSCAKSQTGKSDILQGTWTLNESEKQLADSEVSSCQVFEELEKAKVTIFTLQERLKEADNTNNDLKNCIWKIQRSLQWSRRMV
ncbi:CDK5 regulatory subunit-associated protein 2-like isoform X2 [Rhinatrema bivittatum]|uniref:CDK5 regulatory subunit-associated protein 2-like isoform X2 n=1 Tax=Rhinatrema bivittatum TaxID=194408 RepID=UPI001126A86B|nr:CDK5 regulatory subunit-associated protein 2-like isoform X2 [Rhinatrema bivittatum]